MEWTVVTVLVVIVGLFATVGAPIIRLVITLTKVNVTLSNVSKDLEDTMCSNKEAHQAFLTHNIKQDSQLQDHEMRIHTTEQIVDTMEQKVDTILQTQYNGAK